MKPIEDRGHAVAATKPLQLKRYEPGRLPDPALCVDCLIVINDRHDGVPRARLAMSNGASWDHVAWLADHQPASRDTQPALHVPRETQPIDVQAIDVTAIVDQVRSQVLAAIPRPERVIQALPAPDDRIAALQEADRTTAAAFLEIAELVNTMQRELADVRGELDAIKRVRIVSGVAA